MARFPLDRARSRGEENIGRSRANPLGPRGEQALDGNVVDCCARGFFVHAGEPHRDRLYLSVIAQSLLGIISWKDQRMRNHGHFAGDDQRRLSLQQREAALFVGRQLALLVLDLG